MPVAETATIRVEAGDTVGDLAERLVDAGLLDSPRLLRWTTQLSGLAGALKVGEYPVLSGDTPQRLLSRLVLGDVISYRFRITEGASVASALADLRTEPKLRQTLGDATPETLLAVLGLDAAAGSSHGEGWFFPDTYRFVAGDEDREVLRRAYRKMRRELDSVWASRAPDLPYSTPYEALIVASIVEKETARAADRAHVSQVIAARFASDMRLQVDPTVIYGLAMPTTATSPGRICGNPRRTILMFIAVCRRRPSRCRARHRCARPCIRAERPISISSREAMDPASSPPPSKNTLRR